MLLSLAGFAQAPQRLSVKTPAQFTLKAGATATERLQVEVQPGYHVNTNKPRGEFLIPLKLTWAGESLMAAEVRYPQGEEIQVGPDKLAVFTGAFAIETEFKAAPDAKKGPSIVTGRLTYQACNNQMCFRPAAVDVKLPVVVE